MAERRNVGPVLRGVLLGALAAVALTALAVGLLLSGTWLYRVDVELLGIPERSGYSREMILENYGAVVAFLSPFSASDFSMPTLQASEGGARHFLEVKNIVAGLYIAGAVSLALSLLLLGGKRKLGHRGLAAASAASLSLPLFMTAAIAIDFDGFFVLFHKIFFRNDLWIFDPVTDPVIRILPAEYFMHCAVAVVLFWLCGGAALFWASCTAKRKAADALPGPDVLSFYKG